MNVKINTKKKSLTASEVSVSASTFQCTVIGSEEDRHSSYVVVRPGLTTDEARENYLGPSGVVAWKSSVYNVTLSER